MENKTRQTEAFQRRTPTNSYYLMDDKLTSLVSRNTFHAWLFVIHHDRCNLTSTNRWRACKRCSPAVAHWHVLSWTHTSGIHLHLSKDDQMHMPQVLSPSQRFKHSLEMYVVWVSAGINLSWMEQMANLALLSPVIASLIVLCLDSHCVGILHTQKTSLSHFGGGNSSYPMIHRHLKIPSIYNHRV